MSGVDYAARQAATIQLVAATAANALSRRTGIDDSLTLIPARRIASLTTSAVYRHHSSALPRRPWLPLQAKAEGLDTWLPLLAGGAHGMV